MTYILTVGGTAYDQSTRKLNSLILDSWGWDYDSDLMLDFHEYIGLQQPRFSGPQTVSLTKDANSVFMGDIVAMQPSHGSEGKIWGYHCLGLKNRANYVPVKATDYSGNQVFNLPATDDLYDQQLAGQSVGQIISFMLNQQSSDLSAIGVTTDATTTSQLNLLTFVPQDPVYFSGERFWMALDAVLRRWARNIRSVILPTGLVRFVDITGQTAGMGLNNLTLTLGVDPVPPPDLSREWTTCASRVQARGLGQIYPAYVSWNSAGLWASGTAVLSAGAVTSVTNINSSKGWTTAPTVLFTGAGSGATGTAVISGGVVTGVTITAGGSYTSPPQVWFNPSLTLMPAWTAAQQAAWTMGAFTKPADASDQGTVVTTNSPTVITIKSADATRNWPVNYWNNRLAWIYVSNTNGVGLTYQESRPITSNTALTAGGTSQLTLGMPLDNAATNAWSSYQIIGTVDTTGTGEANVYRLFNIVTPGQLVEKHLVVRSPVQVPFVGVNNASAQLVTTASCQLLLNGTGGPQPFRLLLKTGQVLFDRPVVETFNSPQVLTAGGSSVVMPDTIYMMVFYARAPLLATYPPDSGGLPVYAGTSYTKAGLQRTQTVDVDSWGYVGATSLEVQLAQMMWQSMCDTIIEGNVRYIGEYTSVQNPAVGCSLSFAGVNYTTGDESLQIPLRAVTYRLSTFGGGTQWMTEMRCSSRRDPKTDDSLYMHTAVLGSGAHWRQDYVTGATGGWYSMENFDWRGRLSDLKQRSDQALEGMDYAADLREGVRGVSGAGGSMRQAIEAGQEAFQGQEEEPSDMTGGTWHSLAGPVGKPRGKPRKKPSRARMERQAQHKRAQAREAEQKKWVQGIHEHEADINRSGPSVAGQRQAQHARAMQRKLKRRVRHPLGTRTLPIDPDTLDIA